MSSTNTLTRSHFVMSKFITAGCAEQAGVLYTTCSRQLAKSIKSNYHNTIASTGGPNTLITLDWTKEVQNAIRTSASIECAGQCTALRQAVVPDTVTEKDVEALFDDITHVDSPVKSLKNNAFDGVFSGHHGTSQPSATEYKKHKVNDAYFKVSHEFPSPPSGEVNEYWRKVVVDVTNVLPSKKGARIDKEIKALSRWLIQHQPISLAVNAKRSHVLDVGRNLFENTSLVVNTLGSTDKDDCPPAMTCQARPQEAECFGEFPPRKTMREFTEFPVIIPSSTPSYDTCYQSSYLETLSVDDLEQCPKFVSDWLSDISDKAMFGYCIELLRYLHDATRENPKRGFGTGRTALWGLQRPPLLENYRTLLHCSPDTSFDDLSPAFLLFYATNARSQVELSVNSLNTGLLEKLAKHDLDNHIFKVTVESEETLDHRLETEGDSYYNVVKLDDSKRDFVLPGQFVSLFFGLGHIKSTMKNDEEFVKYISESDKWLKMA